MLKEITISTLALLSLQHAEAQKPNIIFIYADDWGYGDLSLHGHPVITTPNLDRLASEGMNFKQFNVLNPVCSPSRAAVMTGHYPARYSIHQHFADPELNRERNMPDWLDPQAPMLPRLLKEAGYKTAHYGKWHLTNTGVYNPPLPVEYGYDESRVFNGPGPNVGVPSGISTGATVNFTMDFIQRAGNEPFFVNLWIHESHTVINPPQDAIDAYAHVEEPYRSYYACISYADRELGRLFQFLKENNLEENTLVIFSSDNGPEVPHEDPTRITYYSRGSTAGLRGQKRSLHEGGVGVPFIVHWPGRVPAGQVDHVTNISAVDILPTFLSIAGIDLPANYEPDGEDFSAAFFGEPVIREKPLFWEWRGHSGGENWPRLAVRSGDWKLLTNFEGSVKTLYNIQASRFEQNDSAAIYPVLADSLFQLLMDWKETLPTEADPNSIGQEPEVSMVMYNDFQYKQYVNWSSTMNLTITDKTDNPMPSVENQNLKVAKVLRGSGLHANVLFPLKEYLDLSENNLFSVKVFYQGLSPPPSNCNVRLILRNNGLGATQHSITLPVTEANKWVEYSFDCSAAHGKDTYNQVLLFFSSPDNIGNSNGQEFYLSDLTGPPVFLGYFPNDIYTSLNGDSIVINLAKSFSDLEQISDPQFELSRAGNQEQINIASVTFDLNAIYLHLEQDLEFNPHQALLLSYVSGTIKDIDEKELSFFREFLVKQSPPPPFSLKFVVKDYHTNQFIQGANVTVDTINRETNPAGEAIFLLQEKNYIWFIHKENYFPVESVINLVTDSVLNIRLKKSVADLRFSITDGTNPIYNAEIEVNNEKKYTNTLGLSAFNQLAVNVEYPYTIKKDLFRDIQRIIFLEKDTLIEVSMELATTVPDGLNTGKLKIWQESTGSPLQVESEKIFRRIELFNILGEMTGVYNFIPANSKSLDVTGLKKGMYFIRIYFDQNFEGRKIIIK